MKHVLKVDGYNVGDRLLEGVMFDVHITESNGDLTITKVVAPVDSYSQQINTARFLPDIEKQVQENIDYLRKYAKDNQRTLSEELALYSKTTGDDSINVLNEV